MGLLYIVGLMAGFGIGIAILFHVSPWIAATYAYAYRIFFGFCFYKAAQAKGRIGLWALAGATGMHPVGFVLVPIFCALPPNVSEPASKGAQ